VNIRRILFLINSLWELLRFLALFLAAALVLRRALAAEAQLLRWLLVLAAPGLILPAGFLFLYLAPARHAALLGPLRLAKLLARCASSLLILASPFELLRGGLAGLPSALIPLGILAGTVVVDAVLLLALLPAREERAPHSLGGPR